MLSETRPELKDKNGINIGLLFPLHSTLIISLLCLEISLSLLHMHTHVHTYMHTPTHAEQPYNRFDRSFGFIKGLREFLIAKRSTERYACVCVYVHKHIFHQLSYCCSVAQSCLTLWSHELKHSKLPCLSPSPGACSNSCPLSQWCHSTILFSVIPFFSCLLSFPALGSFSMSWLFTPGGLSISNRLQFSSVQFSRSVVSDSLQPHESQHARLPCLSPTTGVHSNSRPSGWWCHPAISSSVVPFSSSPQSLPASVFSNESTLHMRRPKYWSFSFGIIPSKEHPGLISFIMDWLKLPSTWCIPRAHTHSLINAAGRQKAARQHPHPESHQGGNWD